ncbi:L,D-transpeptidase [Labrys sp. KNU-23]|uniref:L,D-transpeptidase n=1 Tax=Labrys sp. KNU-23 TaxID=2789216 RepID=UPI0011ED29C8|nr:L,D-transpeptidase [Labrys sp. KNU-23]QEN86045.1 L,D-transpeptidase [Labrys sp. KNU-23]
MQVRLLSVPSVAIMLALPACAPSVQRDHSVVPVASQFSGEQFPVRLINRARFPTDFAVGTVDYPSTEARGSIIVDTGASKLYHIEGDGKARRYAIAVGKAGYAWKGMATIARKTEWPAWYPTDDMRSEAPGIPNRIPPGSDNPLGARAMYLYTDGKDTLYRIHGTSEPWTIGTKASSGCIRMFNEDVIDLYSRTRIGAKVIVK